ncbi:N-acetylmuramoyl-L-alanine amidase [Nocardia tenerifensis]|uniref:N-acetylmuramoyl-L-alanine amidase n=1 Tax=Nocardia tenerifensis TaxID=228006 RepID=A0A318JN57_9NOCA|nr:N-acetylmuramoyl-L-alanine amidase [Nocardia tenerifensis]PXX52647.1 N-acetylmuramoyl-L-alanine amidase [Nocardia tenerifensis]
MSWTGDPIWLADVLREAGLRVIEHEGWRERGHGDFADIRGVLCHHTAGGGANDWRIVQYGRPDLDGPLAQLVLERDGTYRVIAAGVCWHAGRGSWPGWPTDNANYHVIGIEAVSRGDGSDWTPVQLDAYKRGCAAILRRIGRDANDCVGHREYSSEGKIDPAGIDMDEFRTDVQAIIEREDAPMSAPEVQQIIDFISGFCGPIGSDVKDIREQLCGLEQRDRGQYKGWPQLDDRTVVDALADMISRMDKLERRLVPPSS